MNSHSARHGLGQFLGQASTAVVLAVLFSLGFGRPALADPYPPYWSGGTGPAIHFAPVAWPAETAWKAYTMRGAAEEDRGVQDQSNGGTSPQNYVNVTSGCTDVTLPSVYYAFDTTHNVLFFRWRVQQQANTYATGPSAGNFAVTDPWKSALWTVLIDLDGDGYREFDVQLDGSSGAPGVEVDRLTSYYSNTPSQIPEGGELWHNPSAFVDQATSKILNFHDTVTPDTAWLSGSSATVWDYGTTRATIATDGAGNPNTCGEYFVDYQIPLAMLNASSRGGPTVTASTPMAFLFATSNSLNNPLQKDVVYMGDFVGSATAPAPFGDTITPDGGGPIEQPIVSAITTAGCGSATLTAHVQDSIKIVSGQALTTLTQVAFYYYADTNSNGLADDGGSWVLIGNGTSSTLGVWTISWNSSTLPRGQYLIGVQAVDDGTLNTDLKSKRTFSYLDSTAVALLTPPGTEHYYANPAPTPGVVYATFVNTCGTLPPYVTKSVNPATQTANGTVTFTVTVNNPTASAITVTGVSDPLPSGFAYVNSTTGGTLGVTANPSVSGQVLTWGSLSASVPASSSRTLTFNATVGSVTGTFSNTGSAVVTGTGTLTSDPVQVGVGAPRLTLSKAANAASYNPGDTISYTITYSNDSPISVTNVAITDPIPTGATYVTGSLKVNNVTKTDAADADAASCDGTTATFSLGSLAAGEGPYTVSFQVTVTNPYPGAAPIPMVNTATITSTESTSATASTNVFINAPRPVMQILKDGDILVAPGANGTYTLSYKNTGNATATSVVVTDTIPTGFTYASNTGGGTYASGVVTWNIGSVASGGSGSVTVTIQAANPFTSTNPATNTTAVTSTQTPTPVTDTFKIGVSFGGCATYYYHVTTANVGSAGTQPIANITVPTSGTDSTKTATTPQNNSTAAVEIARFYQDPVAPGPMTLTSATAVGWFSENSNGTKHLLATMELYDYNPTGGATTLLASGTTAGFYAPTPTSTGTMNLTLSGSPTLQSGHRLLWIWKVQDDNNGNTVDVIFYYDSTTHSSYGGACTTTAENLVIDKQVDKLSATPGNTLQYTIKFTNLGGTDATSAQIVDTLPAGVTYTSATLNGSAATPSNISGQQYTFSVNSTGAAAGTVVGFGSGTLVINATVNQPLAAGISSLPNSATLKSAVNTTGVTDTATTAVILPSISVTKAANKSLTILGDTVTYTITVLNSGSAAAFTVAVSDTIPAASYFGYVSGSIGGGDSRSAAGAPTLTWTINSLAAGASGTLTFQMRVLSSGLPTGVTTRDNSASATNGTVSGTATSNTVTVSISANPKLVITKSVSPATGPYAAGAILTYSLLVQNTGSAAATAVEVLDPIPANTAYVSGGQFDAVNNRVAFAVGTLNGGASTTVSFVVRVLSRLANGTTLIPNTATVSASNAASRNSLVSVNADAAPVLSLTKTGPTSIPYPATTLSQAASNTTTLNVNSAAELHLGDLIQVNSTNVTITAISGTQVRVSAVVTAASGAPVYRSIAYVLLYGNTGNANATSVTLTDTLPAGLTFVSATPAQNSGVYPAALVWNLGTLAPGDSGSITVIVFPNSAGDYTNSATLTSTETSATPQTVTTGVGGLAVTKSTSTPNVTLLRAGTTATYTITVTNTRSTAATGVQVTDLLDNGFTYASTSSITWSSGGAPTTTVDPTLGDTSPLWGTFTIAASSGTLTIVFTANVGSGTSAGVHQNALTVTSTNTTVLPFDPLSTTAEDVTVTIPLADLSLVKTPSKMTPNVGETITYTIRVSNGGPVTATAISVQDVLPSGYVYFGGISGGDSRNAGGAPTLTWTINSLASGTYTDLTYQATVQGTGTYTNAAQVMGVDQFDPNSVPGDGTGDDFSAVDVPPAAPPTAVVVAEFAAGLVDNVPLIEWRTVSEVRTLGFNLYEANASGHGTRLVNSGLIPSGGLRSGSLYVVPDNLVQPGRATRYLLEEIEERGGRHLYGPFNVVVPTVEALGIDPDAGGIPRLGVAAPTAVSAGHGSGERMRIGIETPGLRYLSAAALAEALGVKVNRITTALTRGQVRLSCGGKPVGYVPVAGGAGLYFYGEASTSPYTKENVYWVELAAAGVMPTVTSGANPAPVAGGFTTEVLHVEQDLRALLDVQGTPGEILWVWQTVVPQSPVLRTFRGGFTLTGLAATGGTAAMEIRLIGGSDSAAPLDHAAGLYINGQLAGTVFWDGKTVYEARLTFPAAWLVEGYNELMVRGIPQPGVVGSQFHVDAFDVTYPRVCLAAGNLLEFNAGASSVVTIDGFSGAAVAVVDITNPQKPGSVSGLTIRASAAGFSVSFTPVAAGHRYVGFLAAAVPPAQGRGVTLKPLRTKNIKANYVVIVPEALAAAAQPLAKLRATQGLLTKVVTFEAVCDEFNDGRHEPEAIRRFLSYAWANWKTPPQYVVLAGSGSYDYRNHLNYGDCLLPTPMAWTEFGYAASDVSYGDVKGADGLPEIAIGRLPALTPEQLKNAVDRIVAYETSRSLAWLYDAAFLSDTPDPSGDFPADCTALAAILSPSASITQISLGDTDLATARASLQVAFQDGSRLMLYLGHAGFDRLTRAGLLTATDIPALTNAPRFPVLVAGTCITGDYSTPGRDCLGEQLLAPAGGGCVAVWSPSVLAHHEQSRLLLEEFLRSSQTQGTRRLGDVAREAILGYERLMLVDSDTGRIYNLLGDPATLLGKPAQKGKAPKASKR